MDFMILCFYFSFKNLYIQTEIFLKMHLTVVWLLGSFHPSPSPLPLRSICYRIPVLLFWFSKMIFSLFLLLFVRKFINKNCARVLKGGGGISTRSLHKFYNLQTSFEICNLQFLSSGYSFYILGLSVCLNTKLIWV